MQKYILKYILLTILMLLSVCPLVAESPPDSDSPVQVELLSETQTLQPGQPFWVVLHLTTAPHWHSYWKNPGDAGMATGIEWKLPPEFSAGATEWPIPQRFDLHSIISFGYEGDVWLLTPINTPATLTPGKSVELSAEVNWVVCNEENCLPGSATVNLQVAVDSGTPQPDPAKVTVFANARAHLPKKQWSVQAQKTQGFIQVSLQAPEGHASSYTEAHFFPEEAGLVDSQAQVLLTANEEKPGHYLATLKMADEGLAAKVLNGVIVLRSPQNSEALDVHLPLATWQESHEEAVSMSDQPPLVEPLPVSDFASDDMAFEGGIGLALLFAFLGGLILNLMPCVLPVISFKVLSFVKMSGQCRKKTLKHGIAFSAGVILSFWVLAGMLLLLQAYGRSVGWGFQLQEPLFVACLAAMLLALALSLFGVFELGTSVTAAVGKTPKSDGLFGSFLSGILATAVATPCTGPFLGSAVGFAVTLPAFLSLMIFTTLGLGMAMPYLLLAAYPQLLRFLPKPGPWMVTFKELMGFFMLATVLWLLWVFSAQTSSMGTALLLCSFFFLALGCWVLGKWGTPIQSQVTRWTSYAVVTCCFAIGGVILYTSTSAWVIATDTQKDVSEQVWQEFSQEKVADLQKQGVPVFVDFTAKWCLICQANHLVLSTSDVTKKFDELGVVRMKADWTRNDSHITEALRKFGRNGVPLYLLYGADPSKPPIVLPQVLTPDLVVRYLDKMAQPIANG